MNATERSLAVLNYQSFDRLPVVHFGYWNETLEKWFGEGHLPSGGDGNFDLNLAWKVAGQKLGFDYEWSQCFGPNSSLLPAFKPQKVAAFPDGSFHLRNAAGVTEVYFPNTTSIHAEVDHLLKDRESWEEHYKPRLQWSPERVPTEWPYGPDEDLPKGLYCGSLLGVIRDFVGMEELSYITADDPGLLDEMIATIADLSLQNVQAAFAAGHSFDYAHFWEDICFKSGPLVNPALFKEKVGSHYRRITDELHRHGVRIVSVDCDGLIDDLLPVWLENGVNTMFPIEVGTWHASIKPWREKYGKELRGVGGMNKNLFALDQAAIDAEIERLKPLVALGGYIPCPDHRIPPDAQWDLVCYYCDKIRELRL